MKFIISLISMMVFSSGASSVTQADSTKIKELYMAKNHGEYVFIKLENSPDRSGCSKNGTWDYTLELTTDFGRAMYSTILSAYFAGKTVTAKGNVLGECNEIGSVESLDVIWIK
jgi:hypothetical protein